MNRLASGLLLVVACCAPPKDDASRVITRSIPVEGDKLASVRVGQGPAVILVHGGFQDHRMWAPFIDAFSRKRHVIAYSRRNHFPNKTDANGLPDYAADQHGRDLAALIRNLDFAQVDLVGHSSGASTVLFLAAQNPELVRSIVIVEPPLASLLTNNPDDRTAASEFQSRFGLALAALRQGDRAQAVQLFADAVGGPGTYARRTTSQKAMMLDNVDAHAADAKAVVPRVAFTSEMARKINLPVLLINGTRSPAFFHRVADRLASCLPKVERQEIEASHTVPGENPDKFERAVLSFLR